MPPDDLQRAELATAGDDPSLLKKEVYEQLKAQLSFAPDLRIVALTIAVNHALIAFGLWLLTLGTTPTYLAAQLVFPVVFFQAFSLLHDCGHGSCMPKRWMNTWLGHYVSAACFLPYFPWKYVHTLHHTWTGNLDRDPTLKVLRRWRERREVPLLMRIAWRSWMPLGAVINHVVLWSHPLQIARDGTKEKLRRCLFSVLYLLSFYGGLHLYRPQLFCFTNFLPAIFIYLIAVELVNLPHHSDLRTATHRLPLWEQAHSTRTCYYPIVVSELFVLNFNFHVEHHLFPALPWYRLRKARGLVKPLLGVGYEEAIGLEWNLKRRSTDIRKVLNAE